MRDDLVADESGWFDSVSDQEIEEIESDETNFEENDSAAVTSVSLMAEESMDLEL